MKTKPIPSAEFLHERLIYKPDTGELFWKERPRHHFVSHRQFLTWNKRYSGKIAGTKHYQSKNPNRGKTSGAPCAIVIRIKGGYSNAARLIFSMMGAPLPEGMDPDHKDNNPFNNSWDNLRGSTKSQNNSNRRKSGKTTLPKGVTFSRSNKYIGQIQLDGKNIYLGSFDTAAEAFTAYCAKAKELHGEFARFI